MQSGGLLLFYQVQQYFVQYRMQQALNCNTSRFQKLTLTLDDFQNSKINNNEISLNGKMYDIKSIKTSDDTVELIVLNDTEEESIIEIIKRIVGNENQQNRVLPNKLIQLLSLIYLSTTSQNNLLLDGIQQIIFQSFCETIVSHKTEIFSPPPELV